MYWFFVVRLGCWIHITFSSLWSLPFVRSARFTPLFWWSTWSKYLEFCKRIELSKSLRVYINGLWNLKNIRIFQFFCQITRLNYELTLLSLHWHAVILPAYYLFFVNVLFHFFFFFILYYRPSPYIGMCVPESICTWQTMHLKVGKIWIFFLVFYTRSEMPYPGLNAISILLT